MTAAMERLMISVRNLKPWQRFSPSLFQSKVRRSPCRFIATIRCICVRARVRICVCGGHDISRANTDCTALVGSAMQAESTIAIKTERKWSTHGKQREEGKGQHTRPLIFDTWPRVTAESALEEGSDYNADGNR